MRNPSWNIYTVASIFVLLAIVCFNKNLTECSILSKEFQRGMSNPKSVSGHSFNTLFCLKS